MWRFYAAATALVAAFLFLITQHREPPPDLRVSARANGTPSPPRFEAAAPGRDVEAVRGDAPWALSALPDCARQHTEMRGSAAEVRAKIPADATPVSGDVRAGPCTIHVGADGIIVRRGEDRLRIPPPARLLHLGARYYLYRENRKGAELRVYSFVDGS